MLLRVLELGYDNEFQTQIFSLIVTKVCEEPRVCFQSLAWSWWHFVHQRLIVRKLFSQPEILIGQREGEPTTPALRMVI